MKKENQISARKQNRMADYDYSRNGAYFITICSKDCENIFSEVYEHTDEDTQYKQLHAPIKRLGVGARIVRPHITGLAMNTLTLSPIGKITEEIILQIPQIYQDVFVDVYCIMPNHIHMIIVINNRFVARRTRNARPCTEPNISNIINQMKGCVTKKIGFSPWQKLFHDHVIRNEREYNRIVKYIENNPNNWRSDNLYDTII
jgi:REP element-mobilizing transposase RayT